MTRHSNPEDDRQGARQPQRFDPGRAARLDDPARFEYVPPAEVARLLEIPAHGRVLDFGTGTGTYAIELARLRPEVEVVALDEQAAMLEQLRAKLAAVPVPNVQVLPAGESSRLAGRIDRLLALNVLHELGDPALKGLRTFLRPGGTVLFIDWNAEVERPVGPPREHVYSPPKARARLEKLSFQTEAEPSFPYHYVLRAW